MTSRASRLSLLTAVLVSLTTGMASAQAPSAPREGIAVHGSWTVTVTRAGKVVERREFQNALALPGMRHLAELLARVSVPGKWTILLEADGTGAFCANNEFINGDDTDCAISESNAELTVSAVNGTTVVLEGTETTVRAANIAIVNTFQQACSGLIAPTNCEQVVTRWQFTRKLLDAVIPVQAGDRIEVKVMISFS